MIALTAALVAALSLGAGDAADRRAAPKPTGRTQGATLTNAARARLGLLPRKPRKVSAAKQKRRGRPIITTVSHLPTFLPEPIPVAEAPEAPGMVRDVRLAAASVVTDVTLVLRYGP